MIFLRLKRESREAANMTRTRPATLVCHFAALSISSQGKKNQEKPLGAGYLLLTRSRKSKDVEIVGAEIFSMTALTKAT